MSKTLHRPFPMWSPRWQDPSQRLDTAKSGHERYLVWFMEVHGLMAKRGPRMHSSFHRESKTGSPTNTSMTIDGNYAPTPQHKGNPTFASDKIDFFFVAVVKILTRQVNCVTQHALHDNTKQ